jgi:hypothetical protein
MKLSTISVDPKAVEDGDWVKNLPEMGNLELKVRGQNSSAWKARRKKLINALPRNLRNRADGLPDAIEENMMSTLLIEAGLLDWRNLELATKLIKDPATYLFRDAVIAATARVGAAEADADEQLAGNLSSSSDGSSATAGHQTG